MMKKVLVLGGTQFIGRKLVERLQGIETFKITLFNRQRSGPDLFPDLNKIKGDRETGQVASIAGINWDFVIDLSCFYPDSLRKVLKHIHTNVEKYILVSSCSVYDNANNQTILRNEEAEILSCNTLEQTDRTNASYGQRKAECERILRHAGLNYVILRPALVYGAYDRSDRMYYWLYQVKHNDELMLPDYGKRTFSSTYVEDLVETIISALNSNISCETYNVISTPKTSIKQLVSAASELLNKNLVEVNATAHFLETHQIQEWTDLPLWLNSDYYTYSNQKLIEHLAFEPTPFKQSILDTIRYFSGLNWPVPTYGIDDNRSRELLSLLLKSQ